ncbi:S26 family signal peptidase [Actinomadura kijaniata]|uniref:Signal peptidase I n=1 Tax=Actinomadura namibiensis TaxID=182080 RepID=A0A7W3LR70_ACTNM|nr:S26 family signal peptidase [Actinomadura namibiensis]MBA8952846.1 signal peptidase I [Actinomadura namibiensis]
MTGGHVRTAALGALLAAGAVLWFRRHYLVATVRGRSMEPTYREGDQLLVRRAARPRAGQAVVVRAPDPPLAYEPDGPLTPEEANAPEIEPPPADRLLVKRAVAVAGDPVPRDDFPALRDTTEPVVPPGSLVVLGDNPSVSWDSREYGFVRPADYVGVVLRRLTG